MGTRRAIESDVSYFKHLIGAGWEGIASARRTQSGTLMPSLKTAPWKPTMAGAALGLMGARLVGRRNSSSTLALGGLMGSAVGFGAAVAWTSRGFVGDAARSAMRSVNVLRDEHWLAMNPIDYA